MACLTRSRFSVVVDERKSRGRAREERERTNLDCSVFFTRPQLPRAFSPSFYLSLSLFCFHSSLTPESRSFALAHPLFIYSPTTESLSPSRFIDLLLVLFLLTRPQLPRTLIPLVLSLALSVFFTTQLPRALVFIFLPFARPLFFHSSPTTESLSSLSFNSRSCSLSFLTRPQLPRALIPLV